MELTQLGFLEELLAPRRDDNNTTWSTLSTGLNELFPNGWSFDSLDENPILSSFNPPFSSFSTPLDQRFECPYANETAYPFGDGFTVPEIDSSYNRNEEDSVPFQPSMEDEEFGFLGSENQSFEEINNNNNNGCKIEERANEMPVVFNMGFCGENKSTKSKKLEGQPSKNLMAERRRRKRLNDRLSMLRSIVPKISKLCLQFKVMFWGCLVVEKVLKKEKGKIPINVSIIGNHNKFLKMDRTSILGDTIDYMKELLERIGKLQEEETEDGKNQMNVVAISKELKPNEVVVRNSPKFDVERREQDTRISICCAGKPGLLLSTVNTLEALGLEIQQCVISSFNDFSVQASCSEVSGQKAFVSPEEIKQALFKNAGYGGRCL